MTDKEILEAMRSMLEAERENTRQMLEPINTRLDQMDKRFDTIEGKQDKLSVDIAHLNHELVPKVKVIYEGYAGQRDKLPQLDIVEGRVDKLEDDMFAVKEHLKAE